MYESVGRPFFPARIRIVDDEIQVKSAMGFARYTDDANLLEQNIRRPGGFLAPGDLGYLDERGYLHVTGRASDLIICGGVNVYPAEIEQVVLQYEGVREVCAFGFRTNGSVRCQCVSSFGNQESRPPTQNVDCANT